MKKKWHAAIKAVSTIVTSITIRATIATTTTSKLQFKV